MKTKMNKRDLELPKDLICGALAIGRFITPDEEAQKLSDNQLARKVFHLVATSRLPVFRLGSRISARRSVLLAWIAQQEARNSGQAENSSQALTLAAGQHS